MEFLLEIPPSCRISEFGRGKNREFAIPTAEKSHFHSRFYDAAEFLRPFGSK